MFALTHGSDEIEIRLGAFDEAPGSISPAYELFVGPPRDLAGTAPGAAIPGEPRLNLDTHSSVKP